VVAFNTIQVEKKRSGPTPGPKPTGELIYMGQNAYDPGREVDDWIIEQADTKSFATLAKELEEKGIKTARGLTKWDRAQARRLYHFALTRRAQREA
jgi:hypothetical protein